MNSEELEQSLRTEFESYLKQISAGMQREASQFQEKIEAEFERHKTQLGEVFQDFSARLTAGGELDASFKDSVVEHLRLARDEGARITATAIGEAEELQREAEAAAAPVAGIGELRDGINDISSQTSQASILKSLVENAGQFTPRGAFFIIKNEHFVGWRVFGNEEYSDDRTAREIFFHVSSDSILGESVKSLSAIESRFGTRGDDSIFLDKLGLGEPDKMYAIPLVARGRGVAVLYADGGTKGAEANVEALETLVRVAGLTVEILAAAPGGKSAGNRQNQKAAKVEKREEPAEPTNLVAENDFRAAAEDSTGTAEESVGYDSSAAVEAAETVGEPDYQYTEESESFSSPNDFQPDTIQTDFNYNNRATEEYADAAVETVKDASFSSEVGQPVYDAVPVESESYSWNQPSEPNEEFAGDFQPTAEPEETTDSYQPANAENDYSGVSTDEYRFETTPNYETAEARFEEPSKDFDGSAFDSTFDYSPAKEATDGAFEAGNAAPTEVFADKPPAEVADEPAAKPSRSRFSDKNVDLPIEVTEDERRLHNDARRFARLLVSEIKLYNEQKVKEGRDGSDLYDRLREAIDRSREMYDKRIQPPVAAKFDYFNYEVVNTLAEGDEAKLGSSYPGATV